MRTEACHTAQPRGEHLIWMLGKTLRAPKDVAYLHVNGEQTSEKDDEEQLVSILRTRLEVDAPVSAISKSTRDTSARGKRQ